MRTYSLIAMALILGAMGCSKDSNNSSEKKQEVARDVTDTSSCQGNPPQGATVYGTWSAQFASEHVGLGFEMTFNRNNMASMTLFCEGGKTATVHSRITITSNQISFLDSDSSEFGGCHAKIEPDSTNYALVGNCLQFSKDGKTMYLVGSGNNFNVGQSNDVRPDTNQVTDSPDYSQRFNNQSQMPKMPKMPKMPSMPGFPDMNPDSNDDNISE